MPDVDKPSRTRFSKEYIKKRILRNSLATRYATHGRPSSSKVAKSINRPECLDVVIPAWFLEHCVKTARELSTCEIPLVIRDALSPEPSTAKAEDELSASVYEINSILYEPLLNLLSSQSTRRAKTYIPDLTVHDFFLNDAVHVCLPSKSDLTMVNPRHMIPTHDIRHKGIPHKTRENSGYHFLDAVIECFARDIGGHLIIFGPDDLDDLAEQYNPPPSTKGKENGDMSRLVERYGAEIDQAGIDYPEILDEVESDVPSLVHFPYAKLLSLPIMKERKISPQFDVKKQTPLVVHVRKVHDVLDVYGTGFLEGLRDNLSDLNLDALVITTSDQNPDAQPAQRELNPYTVDFGLPYDNAHLFGTGLQYPPRRSRFKTARKSISSESTILLAAGTNPRMKPICIVPTGNRAQRDLFETHRKLDDSHEQENIRLIQRLIRRISAEHCNLPIAQPYAKWNFIEGTPTQEKFVKERLSEWEVADLTCVFSQEASEEHIRKAILRIGRREIALQDWHDTVQEESESSKWSTFPTRTQDIIKKIENDFELNWEQQFLDHLVNPEEIEAGWSQIALEPDVKEAIVQITNQPSNTDAHAYGILKHARVGGALLYGPPGTGKTHLARVLARESKAIMICASAADMQNMYVGETEKAIQGLFSLGRMLSPCTIFLDEADALFRPRKFDDRGWERSQMNQLLYEMDGLKKSKTPPFVLLATNFPSELDHAVLRRVPSRIYIGLPSSEAREQIFQINLKDEILYKDIDVKSLVVLSKGYSGSDIQTVCVQAALICDTVVGDDDKRRLLKQEHFEKAFKRSAPTVSEAALIEIKAFAEDFDPSAVESMRLQEKPQKTKPDIPESAMQLYI